MSEIKVIRTVPVVAIRESVVFPNTDAILSFGRPKSVAAINSAFQGNRVVAIVTQKDNSITDPDIEDLHKVGTIATITQMMSTEGEIHTMVRGMARVRIEKAVMWEPYLSAEVSELSEDDQKDPEVVALAHQLTEIFKKSVNLGKPVEISVVMKIVSGQVEALELVNSIANILDIKTYEKQKLLENPSLLERLKKTIEYLSHETNILDLEKSISAKTQKRFEDQMRKAMLREKKRTIEEELGEAEGFGVADGDDTSEYKAKIKNAKMPKDVHEKAIKELKRLQQMSPHNPESAYIRNYLDWLVDMPWGVRSDSNVSITKANKVLDSEHYGIDKAKQRILEFLAVMKLKQETAKKDKDLPKEMESQPTILCFVGPPGVGKTSIGRSIANALGRKFVRVSLGGIRDEAEIRGHRRTYVGALPGRIVQGIKNSGVKNPVFMLDEVDKVGTDFRGDPTSALLEALDPEQNKEFSDHYLEVPFDLSEVMFVATANTLETIPAPLRDRMEIIRFAGYTETEKFKIAQDFLLPKQIRLQGLSGAQVKFEDAAIKEIINSYTREAGVRDLERNLANVCRKIARNLAEKKKVKFQVTAGEVIKYLGSHRFTSMIAEKNDEVGMATGLSVSSIGGGDILFIEVALMPGTGKLTLTGQLGSVMKESAKAAFSWSKAHWDLLGIDQDKCNKLDVHIHVPEGATPKDGPSAGIAMTTALVSALTGNQVRRDVGMTGEITLRGRVLEIGGVKEKVIAAHRAGLKTVILPKENKKDLEEVPMEVKKDIKFVFAENYLEVLPVAIRGWKSPVKKAPQQFLASA